MWWLGSDQIHFGSGTKWSKPAELLLQVPTRREGWPQMDWLHYLWCTVQQYQGREFESPSKQPRLAVAQHWREQTHQSEERGPQPPEEPATQTAYSSTTWRAYSQSYSSRTLWSHAGGHYFCLLVTIEIHATYGRKHTSQKTLPIGLAVKIKRSVPCGSIIGTWAEQNNVICQQNLLFLSVIVISVHILPITSPRGCCFS